MKVDVKEIETIQKQETNLCMKQLLFSEVSLFSEVLTPYFLFLSQCDQGVRFFMAKVLN